RARGRPPPLDRARLARRDQLTDDRAQERVRDGRRSDRAKAAQVADRPREQPVGAEALEERRVVGLHAEDEAQLLDAGVALGVQDERSIGELTGCGALAV